MPPVLVVEGRLADEGLAWLYALFLGKEGEIFTHPNICSWMDVRPALPNQDGPGKNPLPPKAFHSQSLTGAVPAVPRTSLPLFVSHRNLLQNP